MAGSAWNERICGRGPINSASRSTLAFTDSQPTSAVAIRSRIQVMNRLITPGVGPIRAYPSLEIAR